MNAAGTPPPTETPLAEHAIDEHLVSSLLADQHSDLAALPLRSVDAGWDNAMFRLGKDLAVRLPRRTASAELVMHEQTWLPRIAHHLTLPIPVPQRIGVPGRGYPWRWSVVSWLSGMAADQEGVSGEQAVPFARFLRSLHVAAPADAPVNPVRGVPLHQRADVVEGRMQRLAGKTDAITTEIRQIWETAVRAPLDVPPTWLHGDLHPRNVLVDGGAITGIIDWGDITSGDRATDLAAIWMLFDTDPARQAALAEYGNVSAATLQRAKGWAVLFGVTLLETGWSDNPRNAAIGARTLQRVVD